MPQPNSEHELMYTGWLPGLTAECRGLAEGAGVHVPDVRSELARKLITEPYPAVKVG
jgi:hypothetical protein